ncbi:hypothetical protein SAMN05216359_105252 [Roseateles sp. YR242]|nr:hypothetical protein SAMN05216359_105252 [Roseateles sp. YR242]
MTPAEFDLLTEFATAREREILEAVALHGTQRRAAEVLGVSKSAVSNAFDHARKRAARKGHAPGHFVSGVAPGYLMGKVTVQRAKDGAVERTWERQSPEQAAQQEALRAGLEAMAAELPRVKPRRPAANDDAYSSHLMACYPIGDAHIGMMSWPEETGEAWDLKQAERLHCTAMARLVEMAPACEEAVVVNLGDFLHADNMEGVTTRSGHRLDMDSRYAKMARVAVLTLRTMIDTALTKHKRVRVINAVGNHDDTGSLWLSICLAHAYENEPRVVVDASPTPCHYIRHGATLVGVHHGHSIKPERLPGVMATDRAEDWGQTRHRYWWMGHVHHQSVQKDHPGVSVESFRTLAAKDAYATWGGYRAPRDMKVILLHDQHGEVGRYTVTPEMLAEVA